MLQSNVSTAGQVERHYPGFTAWTPVRRSHAETTSRSETINGGLTYTRLMIGEVLGSYRIVDQLSSGGMGAVYRAEHTLIGRKAAVKVLLPTLSQDQEIVARFFQEAKATAAIGHPGIVEIFDFGFHHDGHAYLVMELLGGQSLRARLESSRILPLEQALAIMEQVTSALGAAHAKGIVHRDLKPDNIMLVPDPGMRFGERVKLLDFGIAKLAGDDDLSGVKTRTGMLMGTPSYMAPEQCRGAGGVDHRADLYSLGCILFRMLCGRTPFVGEGAGEVLGMHMFVQPPAPRSIEPSIEPAVEALILRLLAKKPDERVQTTNELMTELMAIESTMYGTLASSSRHFTSYGTPRAVTAAPVPITTIRVAVGQEDVPVTSQPKPHSRRPMMIAAIALVVVGIAGGIATKGLFSGAPSAQERAGILAADAPRAAVVTEGEAVVQEAPSPELAVAPADPQQLEAEVHQDSADEPGIEMAADPVAVPDAVARSAEPAPRPIGDTSTQQSASDLVVLRISSVPAGASVYHGDTGELLGKTPYVHEATRNSGSLTFEVRHPAYPSQRLTLATTRDFSKRVTLGKGKPTSGKPASSNGAGQNDSKAHDQTFNPF